MKGGEGEVTPDLELSPLFSPLSLTWSFLHMAFFPLWCSVANIG